MRRAFTFCLILAFLSTSCASYSPQSVVKPTVGSAAFSREEQGLFVGITPYLEEEKGKKIFDADLKQARILALQVVVGNSGSRLLAVRKSDFILRLPDGKEYVPVPSANVVTRLESIGGVVGATIAFGLIGLLVAVSAKNQADSNRRVDFQSKEFQDATLPSGESAHGFLYFIMPDDVRELKDPTMVARGLDVAGGANITVMVPLGTLGVWKVQEAPTAQRPNF